MDIINLLAPDLAMILAGLIVAGFTQFAKFLHAILGLHFISSKSLAAIIAISAGFGYALAQGGDVQMILSNTTKAATYVWMTGQGIYNLVKPSKKPLDNK